MSNPNWQRHWSGRMPRKRELPTPHKDFQFDAPWYRLQNACATAEDWPLEARMEVASVRLPFPLTPEHVREIQRRYRAGGVGYKELAREFGVSLWTIGRIVRFDLDAALAAEEAA